MDRRDKRARPFIGVFSTKFLREPPPAGFVFFFGRGQVTERMLSDMFCWEEKRSGFLNFNHNIFNYFLK